MKTMTLLLLSLFLWQGLIAQELKVSQGDTLNKIVDRNIQYAFDNFSDGVVSFKDGAVGKAKLNYNYMIKEMHFVDPKSGEIQMLGGISGIAMVSIGNRQFIPAGSGSQFLELLTKGNVCLALDRSVKTLSKGKTGAYGTVSATSSVQVIGHLSIENSLQTLNVSDNLVVRTDDSYYLYANGKKTFVKNIKSYTKVYPKDKAPLIEKYAVENNIKFSKEEDLIKLTEYSNQL